MDLVAVTASLGDITEAITTIGGILLGAAALAVAFKWGKAALFG